MEKFCLKWNDFQSTVSKSFGVLRQEADFFDVTLVSDDEQHIPAHKLVLSASSDFFRNILRKASHSNPMIYLSGFSSKELHFVMDYIYKGEVQILQDDLDGFLNASQKLKIEGLIGDKESSDEEREMKSNDVFSKNEWEETASEEEKNETVVENNSSQQKIVKQPRVKTAVNTTTIVSQSSSVEDAKTAVDQLVEKTENGWVCKACGKTSTKTSSSDIRRHAETHIDGLAFDCPLCGKTFRSRKILSNHKFAEHKH